MEIASYGNLSEHELQDFLAEIQDDDKEIESIEASIAEDEELNTVEEPGGVEEPGSVEEVDRPKEKRPINSNEHMDYMRRLSAKANHRRKARNKEEKMRIQRYAFNQDVLPLGEEISQENIKRLIELLVMSITNAINSYEAFINRRLTTMLKPFIPPRLINCRKSFPNSVKSSPGFFYRVNGTNAACWAMPDIPFYITPGTEKAEILRAKPGILKSVDRAVIELCKYKQKRASVELDYATRLISHSVQTGFDLLRYNPFWFDILYNDLITKHDD